MYHIGNSRYNQYCAWVNAEKKYQQYDHERDRKLQGALNWAGSVKANFCGCFSFVCFINGLVSVNSFFRVMDT